MLVDLKVKQERLIAYHEIRSAIGAAHAASVVSGVYARLVPREAAAMSPLLLKRKAAWLCALALLLFLLVTKEYRLQYEGVIHDSEPKDVWDFVADFSNMMKLNPCIYKFEVLSEEGDFKKWQYEVKYYETLHNVPFVHNTGLATIRVEPLSESEFLISSRHRTCFLGSALCLSSRGSFKFRKIGAKSTHYEEQVDYECPKLFARFCYSEAVFQRKSIFKNLQSVNWNKLM